MKQLGVSLEPTLHHVKDWVRQIRDDRGANVQVDGKTMDQLLKIFEILKPIIENSKQSGQKLVRWWGVDHHARHCDFISIT